MKYLLRSIFIILKIKAHGNPPSRKPMLCIVQCNRVNSIWRRHNCYRAFGTVELLERIAKKSIHVCFFGLLDFKQDAWIPLSLYQGATLTRFPSLINNHSTGIALLPFPPIPRHRMCHKLEIIMVGDDREYLTNINN